MHETTVTLMGIRITLKYKIYDNGYIEWQLSDTQETSSDIHILLDLLLRVNHSAWIEATLREQEHYNSMARDTGIPSDHFFDSAAYFPDPIKSKNIF